MHAVGSYGCQPMHMLLPHRLSVCLSRADALCPDYACIETNTHHTQGLQAALEVALDGVGQLGGMVGHALAVKGH
jgi:hypothetical protein